MEVHFEDLAGRGLKLIPAVGRIAATLQNHATQPIAGYALEWRWNFGGGRQSVLISHVWEPQLLLPNALSARTIAIVRYRNSIFPGSSRLLTPGAVIGDNTDVRQPEPEEIHGGGWIQIGNPSVPELSEDLRSATLRIDGAIFLDGEFIGPNTTGLWEDIHWASELRWQAARITQAAVERDLPPDEAMSELENVFARRPQPQAGSCEAEARARNSLSNWFKIARAHHDPEGILELMDSWSEARVPQLRRG